VGPRVSADQVASPVAGVSHRPRLVVRSLGVVSYPLALDRQRDLVAARQAGDTPDHLLLLEHPAVITIGVRGRAHPHHLLASRATLRDEGIEVYDVARGGDITYHGPGQLVGYPVLSLKPDRCDVHRYVADLEEVLIRTAASFGVEAGRVPGMTGVWVANDKLGAIGVRLSRWVTSHGFAFNVSTNLDHFRFIVPCGLEGRGVTSLERLLETPPTRAEVEEALVAEFAHVFGRRVVF
jgi:lipoyl(octanoyl) transferase